MEKLSRRMCNSLLRRFGRDGRGNVAVIFALASLPIIGFVGAAVDFSHANSVKVAMQAALDSTALMLSKEATKLSDDQLDKKALAYFKALFTRPEGTNIKINATYKTEDGSQVLVEGTADVPATFMSVLGKDTMTVGGSAIVKWGMSRLRVALVLDNTGSMSSHGKMTALKTATKNLLDQLKSAATNDGDVYVSIIPFAKDVNVGSSNYNASWIDWEGWDNDNQVCTKSKNGDCKKWEAASHSTWNGCVTDRGKPSGPYKDYDITVAQPTNDKYSKFPAEQDGSCPQKMMGLSYNWSAMTALVNGMWATGMTNQAIGLVWGWQSLVGGGPLTAPPKETGYNYNEVIILMSDGLNTQNRWYKKESDIDKRQEKTCNNIKAAGIMIYTIQVNTDGDPTSKVLKNCASTPDKFFLVGSANQMVSIFNTIGTNLTKLRVAE